MYGMSEWNFQIPNNTMTSSERKCKYFDLNSFIFFDKFEIWFWSFRLIDLISAFHCDQILHFITDSPFSSNNLWLSITFLMWVVDCGILNAETLEFYMRLPKLNWKKKSKSMFWFVLRVKSLTVHYFGDFRMKWHQCMYIWCQSSLIAFVRKF